MRRLELELEIGVERKEVKSSDEMTGSSEVNAWLDANWNLRATAIGRGVVIIGWRSTNQMIGSSEVGTGCRLAIGGEAVIG